MGQNTSAKSCSKMFSRVLFISNLKRFFFLPIIHFLICMSAPLMIYSNFYGKYVDVSVYSKIEKLQLVRESIALLSFPVYTFAVALIMTLAVFSYLYTQKSTFMMHSFPVSRRSMFFTNTIVSFLMIIIPILLASIISICMTASIEGAAGSICQSFILFLLETIFFVGISEFVIMCTGTIIAAPILYVIINFLILGMEVLIKAAFAPFIFGMTTTNQSLHTEFAPVVNMSGYIIAPMQFENFDRSLPLGSYFEHINYFIIVAVVGIIFVALSYLIYRKKHVESVGSVLPMKWTRPIMRWGISFCSVVLITILFSVIFYLSQKISEYRMLFIVVTIVFGSITFFASQMIIQRSFRIFNKALAKECALMVVCFCALCILASFDVFGIASRIPNVDEVKELRVNIGGAEYSFYGKDIENAVEIQKTIIDNRNEIIRTGEDLIENKGENGYNLYTLYGYYMKDGRYMERIYDISVIEEKGYESQKTLYDKVVNYFNSPEIIKKVLYRYGDEGEKYPDDITFDPFFSYDENINYDDVELFRDKTYFTVAREDEIKKITDAIIKDIEEGNLTIIKPDGNGASNDFATVSKLSPEELGYNVNIGFTSKSSSSVIATNYTTFFVVDKRCVNLYSTLKELGKF